MYICFWLFSNKIQHFYLSFFLFACQSLSLFVTNFTLIATNAPNNMGYKMPHAPGYRTIVFGRIPDFRPAVYPEKGLIVRLNREKPDAEYVTKSDTGYIANHSTG